MVMDASLHNVDALIFDMDGTLWDATESYAKVWNETCAHFGISTHFVGNDLKRFMGMGLDEIMSHLLGENTSVDTQQFLHLLFVKENEMMPSLGGELFPGVKEGLETLATRYRLFMLSNCSARGLYNFTAFTETTHLFEGLLSQGERSASKSENLRHMIEKYCLKSPIYVGDTQDDANQAHQAGVPFYYAAYGFGRCNDAQWQSPSFTHMVNTLMGVH